MYGYNKINNLIGNNDLFSKYIEKNYVEIFPLNNNFNSNKPTWFKTSILRNSICDYADSYIIVTANFKLISNFNTGNANEILQGKRLRVRNKNISFKNIAPFLKCIDKINGVEIDNAEDLDIVMNMYNLIEYSNNLTKTYESLFNFSREEKNDQALSSVNSKSFKFKTSIYGKSPNDDSINTTNEKKIVIPLKHLSRFFRKLNIPLINFEIELILSYEESCALVGVSNNNPLSTDFKIGDAKLYILVLKLNKNAEIKLYELMKNGFEKEIKWYRYECNIIKENNNNNLNVLIDPLVKNVNGLFVLGYSINNDNNDNRYVFNDYYLPKLFSNECNMLVNNSPIYSIPISDKKELYEKIVNKFDNMSGNCFDEYFRDNFVIHMFDLGDYSKNENIQINFIGKIIGENNGMNMYILEKITTTTFKFNLNSLEIV